MSASVHATPSKLARPELPVVKAAKAATPATKAPAVKAQAAANRSVPAAKAKPAEPGLYNRAGLVGAQAAPPKVAAVQGSGGFIADGGKVMVEIKNSDSGYDNQIYWSADNFATRHLLGIDNQTGSYELGSFAAGTRIDFAIVNGANQTFRSGAASANADNFEHTRSSAIAGGQEIGFEDLYGGGDRDFNDAIIQIRNLPAAPGATTAQPAEAARAEKASAGKDNRSGLGDGSNPGQGAGRTNSPNTGTLNPSRVAATIAPPAKRSKAAAQAVAAPVNRAAAMLYQQLAALDNKVTRQAPTERRGVA